MVVCTSVLSYDDFQIFWAEEDVATVAFRQCDTDFLVLRHTGTCCSAAIDHGALYGVFAHHETSCEQRCVGLVFSEYADDIVAGNEEIVESGLEKALKIRI